MVTSKENHILKSMLGTEQSRSNDVENDVKQWKNQRMKVSTD